MAYDYFEREDSIAGLQVIEPNKTQARLDGRRSRKAMAKSTREGESFVTSVAPGSVISELLIPWSPIP